MRLSITFTLMMLNRTYFSSLWSFRGIFFILVLFLGCVLIHGILSKINVVLITNQRQDTAYESFQSAQTPKVVIIPLEEIKAREREKAVGQLLGENIAPDDPRLVKAIRDHFIDPPSTLQPKMSNPLVKTPQAAAVDKILKGKTGGFYIECGALDGERSSNSIFFERKRDWQGILIEVDPSWYRQIEGKNRKAYRMNACLSPHQYATKMNFKESSLGTGQLVNALGKTEMSVYCFPLLSVMLAMNRTRIDYFSLDVEGYELAILKTIPFDRLDITTFSVEHEHIIGGKQAVLDLMKSNGYRLSETINKRYPTWVRDYIFVKESSRGK